MNYLIRLPQRDRRGHPFLLKTSLTFFLITLGLLNPKIAFAVHCPAAGECCASTSENHAFPGWTCTSANQGCSTTGSGANDGMLFRCAAAKGKKSVTNIFMKDVHLPDGTIISGSSNSSKSSESGSTELRTGYVDVNKRRGGECGTSELIGKGCEASARTTQFAQLTNTTGQVLATTVVSQQGQSAQVQALQSQSQADTLNSSARIQENTGNAQITLGTTNAALGVVQLYYARKHHRQKNEILKETSGETVKVKDSKDAEVQAQIQAGDYSALNSEAATDSSKAGWTEGKGELSKKIITKFDMVNQMDARFSNSATVTAADTAALTSGTPAQKAAAQAAIDAKVQERDKQAKQLKGKYSSKISEVGDNAAMEQKSASSAATAGGSMSLITGIQQMAAGKQAKAAAAALRNAANKIGSNTGSGTITIAPGNTNSATGSAYTPQAITANATDSATPTSSDPDTTATAPPNLDGGLSPAPLATGLDAAKIPSATFTPGSPASNAAGGGGGVTPGAGTNAAQAEQDDSQSKQAPVPNGDKYAASSGGNYAGGGSGGSKGSGDGDDLSKMMEKFLPKDTPEKPVNSILSYASDDQKIDSALAPGKNIFEEISKTYVYKTSHGEVGNGY